MKRYYAWHLCLALGIASIQAAVDMRNPLAGEAAAPERVVVERGAHQRDEFIQLQDGRMVNRPHRVIEMATGMHYWQNGQWNESRDEIEIVPDGGSATKGAHKVHFNGNANTAGAINITTPDNKTLRAHVLGLAFTDTANWQSVMIAELRNSGGLLFPPNQVLYPNAFSGVLADVRYSYTKAGFEQDVILREQFLRRPTTI